MSENESATSGASVPRLSRRQVLRSTGVAAGIGMAASAGIDLAGPRPAVAATPATSRTGTIADLKHIVIVMQENRSWDHFFGTLSLPGSRGFGDKQVLTWQNGRTIFYEPNSRAEGYLLPYRADSTRYNAQNTSSRMWYFAEQDVPWHHAIAKAWTVGDHYHCSLNTSTDPNRIMFWSGTNDPDGTLGGGPRINNSQNGQFLFRWKTYPEVLQDAGVSWAMYLNNDTSTGFLGDFEDNLLRDFAAYDPANATPENSAPGTGLLARANVLQTHTQPPADVHNDTSDLDYVLKDFIADCAAGTLPQVSWITSPAAWSEHPNNAPNNGAVYTDRVIKAVHDNPDLWDSTLIILNYDEPNGANRIGDGGFFDHVVPPIPEIGTAGERAPGLRPGYGGRVPFVLISPWTRGGWVCSEVFDHTSTIQLIEQWTKALGTPAICPHISDWRRSISGDVLSAIDFSRFDNSFPSLPATTDLLASVVADRSLPAVPQPAVGSQTMPTQETDGPLKVRPLPFQAGGVLVEDRSAGSVTVRFTYEGGEAGKAVSLVGLADKYLPSLTGAEALGLGQDALPLTVTNTQAKSYTWDTTVTDGKYALSFYGPDHFVRSFAGRLAAAGQTGGKLPTVATTPVKGQASSGRVEIVLSAEGDQPVRFELKANDYLDRDQVVDVAAGSSKTLTWPTKEGYYDVVITADTGDGWMQRHAGRVAQA